MPLVDQDARRRFTREWTAARKREWLEAHPCGDCGAPASTIRSTVPGGIHKGAWSASPERRERLLRDTVTLCDSCFRERRRAADEVRTERQRESNRAYMARVRGARPRPPKPEPVPEAPPVVPEPEWARDPDPVAPKRRGRPPGTKNKPKATTAREPVAAVDLPSELARRMERRRWREDRRDRLGYGPDPQPPTCRVCRGAHWPDEDCVDDLAG